MKRNERNPSHPASLPRLLEGGARAIGVVADGALDAAERDAARRARLLRAAIPARYRDATLDGCPQGVRDFVDGYGAASMGGIVFHGDVGTGKTYAACAVLRALADRASVRFATGSGILQEIRSTYSSRSDREEDVIARYAVPRVLVIDDIGKEQATDWSLSRLFAIVDRRHAGGKLTVYTCQSTGDWLTRRLSVHGDSSTAEAIVDRMRECGNVSFSGPSRRARP